MSCQTEIIGVKSIKLYKNSNARFERPNISVENEVDFISTSDGNYEISEEKNSTKWLRTVDYSGNYKQNYFDEFTFLVHGINNEVPAIIKELRANRLGYLIEVNKTGGSNYIFETPVFLNEDNTKEVDSITWQVSLSYRIPTFNNYLTLLGSTLAYEPTKIESSSEIRGVAQLGLYINKDIRIRRPNPAIENEVDLIAHSIGSFGIGDVKELPKWTRTISYSGNYKPIFEDEFTFILHGIENNVPGIIERMRNNRLGFIVEVITTNGDSFVFPAPVFLNNENTKEIDSHSWQVSLGYRVPSFEDKLKKLNTILMTNNYLAVADNKLLGNGAGKVIVWR